MTKSEFEIEFEGIYNTIKSYTNDHYIIGYINSLKSALEYENNTKLLLTLEKLINWYEDNMYSIQESKFVYNKTQHIQTKKLLSDFYSTIILQQQ